MRKMICVLLAIMMTAALIGTFALAEDDHDAFPQPEGGKRFESSWALGGGKIDIVYEEEGYRVCVEILNNDDKSGTVWEYSCFYHEDTDTLCSISSLKYTYVTDPVTFDRICSENEYEGFDGEGQETTFAIAGNGALIWNDGHENSGADLEFRNIGSFEGMWRSADGEEPAWAEITWNGLDQEMYFYTVRFHRGDENTFTEYTLQGLYNEKTDKLECTGTAVSFSRNAEGAFDTVSDDTEADAFFSMTGDGTLLCEAENGIVLEYDILGIADNG